MRALLTWLSAHPLVATALALLLIGAIASLVKKLVKVGLILLIIFAIGGGAVFNISQQDIADTGQKLLEKAGDAGKELLEDAGQSVEKEVRRRASDMLGDDSTAKTPSEADSTTRRRRAR